LVANVYWEASALNTLQSSDMFMRDESKRLFELNQTRAARDKGGAAKKAASPLSKPAPTGRAKRAKPRDTKPPKPARRQPRRSKRGK
jgi:hypothetical protein